MVSLSLSSIRYCFYQYLILLFLCSSCFHGKDNGQHVTTVQWNDDKATGLVIPRELFTGIPDDSVKAIIHVHLVSDQEQPPIFGSCSLTKGSAIFEPLIPFTRGLTYEIRLGNRPLAEITIPLAGEDKASILRFVYPSEDTVPNNLLKIYLQFSNPMREGEALQHIVVLKNNRDTVTGIFLDLQPELWNNEGTILTLWLDPGRIKRDLQPNKAMGEPLQEGAYYELVVLKDWQDKRGIFLKDDFHKKFFVTARDSLSPAIETWAVQIPSSNTVQPLIIGFHEPLDYRLLQHTVSIVSAGNNVISGTVETQNEEKELHFKPSSPWQPGSYYIHVEGRLEDLAGNNLNRLFDRDITRHRATQGKDVFTKKFNVR